MEGWANVKEHREEDITLLCLDHHGEVTRKLRSRDSVRAANANPHNLQKGASKPYFLSYAGGKLVTELGGNTFDCKIPLMIDDQPIIGYESDGENLLLYVKLFDEDGGLVLNIEANELVYSTDPWDIELVGNQLTLRAGKGKFLLRLQFIVPNKLLIDRGSLRYKNHTVTIKDQEMAINNQAVMRGCNVQSTVGIAVGVSTRQFGCGMRF